MHYSLLLSCHINEERARSRVDRVKGLLKIAESNDFYMLEQIGEQKLTLRGGQHGQLIYDRFYIVETQSIA